MKTCSLVWVGVAALGLAAPAAAQQPVLPSVPQSLGLQEALDLASRNNPLFRQIQNDRGPAAWGVRNAYASFLPTFGLSGSMSYSGAGSQTFLTQEFIQPCPP